MIEEFVIERGAARIDLVIVGSDFEAFEIKSDFDDFSRMHNQIHAFNRVFDRLWLVTGPRYAGAALQVVPSWWGVLVGSVLDGEIAFQQIRGASPNPAQEAGSVADLLWRDELLDIVSRRDIPAAGSRPTRSELSRSLAANLDTQSLREEVTRAITLRRAVPA